MDAIADAVSDLGGGTVLGRSNVYTYRTPSYMLSSTQVIILSYNGNGFSVSNLYLNTFFFNRIIMEE